MNVVALSNNAKKDIHRLPHYIVISLMAWVDDVESRGLLEVRKISSYHDEPLKGKRLGQRSIRLSKSYRAIYILKLNNEIEFILVEEINKHEY